MIKGSAIQRVILPCVIIIAGFAAAFVLSDMLTRSRPMLPVGYGDTDLSMNGSRLKGFALGMDGLIADWYFMRSLQYIGDKMLSARDVNIDDLRDLNPRLLYPLIDNATELDPHFIAAYSYGAIVLPAIDRERAIAITKKGIANNPSEWRLYQHLGYIYWKLGRYQEAAESFDTGAGIEGSMPFMKLMAASMRTEGGSRATAREIYRQMLAGSDDPMVRLTAERRLQELDSLDEREAIDNVLAEFKQKHGRCANSFGEITTPLMAVKLPENKSFHIDGTNRLVDPTGAPYLLDKDNCRSRLDAGSTGLPVK